MRSNMAGEKSGAERQAAEGKPSDAGSNHPREKEKKHCKIILKRKETYCLEGNLTKVEWEELKEHIEDDDIDGNFVMEYFPEYDENSASDFDDEVDDYESGWD